MQVHARIDPNPEKQSGPVGKFFLSLFFLAFFALGAFFAVMLVKDFGRVLLTYSWTSTEALVTANSISRARRDNEDENPYKLAISYAYLFNGQPYTSSNIGDKAEFSTYERADQVARKFPAGRKTTCYVNPTDPSESLLEHQAPWFALFIILPLAFLLVGGGGIYFIWVKKPAREKRESVGRKAQESAASSRSGLYIFGTLFTLIGAGFTAYYAQILGSLIDSQSWPAVNATVIDSDVIRHESSDSDGTSITYSIDIFYNYEYKGKEYRSSRYSFISVSSSGSAGKRDVVREFRRGKKITAYVNPQDPHEAVLSRSLSWEYLLGLIPLSFLLLGIWMLRRPGRKDRATQRPGTGHLSVPAPETGQSTGPALKPRSSPAGKFFGMIFICLFWNGIVSFFVYQLFDNWRSGGMDWFLGLFLIPFVLIGLLFIFLALHQFLALFNPRVSLSLSSSVLHPGDSAQLGWKVTGNAGKLQELVITVEAREEATYRRGTSTRTDRHIIYSQVVSRQPGGMGISTGTVSFSIPGDVMHSFQSPNNKILWSLKVQGVIPKWPDVDDEYGMQILPREA